jgi:hypothetical protein
MQGSNFDSNSKDYSRVKRGVWVGRGLNSNLKLNGTAFEF